MGFLQEYIDKKWTSEQYIAELVRLIAEYNKRFDTYMVVYATDTDKEVPAQRLILGMRDYQVLFDMLRDVNQDNMDFYLETPGGSGEAAEEIVNLTRRNFKHVNFVIAAEAKSAGTLMALSGNEISMTDSGSLGPIDAQMGIGRSQISAHDYMRWIEQKQNEYEQRKDVSPFDAIMIAQISPGELVGVENALNYAHDLVVKWLPKYKFAHWDKTETNGKSVTTKMKKDKAKEIAEKLSDHTTWRTHGRSLKIQELTELGLKINRIDDDTDRSELVYKIHTVARMIFLKSPIFKIYATADAKLFESASPVVQSEVPLPHPSQQALQVVQVDIGCTQCGAVHKFYVKFEEDTNIEAQMQAQGIAKLPESEVFNCGNCNNAIELTPVKQELEKQARKKVL